MDQKVWMRESESEPYKFLMYVVEDYYNEDRGGWDYKLKNEAGIGYEHWVIETNMRKA